MGPETHAIRDALTRRSLLDARRRAVRAAALTLGESELLALEHLAGEASLSIADLQRRLQLSSGGATALVQRLERAGHVEKRPHPSDRRSAVLALTPLARRRAEEAAALAAEDVERALGGMPPAERAALARFLDTLADEEERRLDARQRRDHAAADDLVTPPLWA